MMLKFWWNSACKLNHSIIRHEFTIPRHKEHDAPLTFYGDWFWAAVGSQDSLMYAFTCQGGASSSKSESLVNAKWIATGLCFIFPAVSCCCSTLIWLMTDLLNSVLTLGSSITLLTTFLQIRYNHSQFEKKWNCCIHNASKGVLNSVSKLLNLKVSWRKIATLLFGWDIGATSGALISLKDPKLSGTDWWVPAGKLCR